MPITNGHDVETGCYGDGANRGWYIGDHVIDIALSYGWELDDEGQAARRAFYGTEPWSSQTDDGGHIDIAEIVTGQGGIIDEAVDWLNEHTPPTCPTCGKPVEWRDSGWYSHIGLRGNCEYRMMDTAQHWTWHWYEGSFFLSPLCENGDCDDDTCAHWD